MKTKKALGFMLAVVMSGIIPLGLAFADDISNDIDNTIDATAEVLNLSVGGATGVVSYSVTPRNGDGKQGCNLTGSTTLTVTVSSSDESVATVSPSSITFTSCGSTPSITVTPVGVGESDIILSEVENTTAGSFSLLPATFKVVVGESGDDEISDTTPPIITYTITPEPNVYGWHNTDVNIVWEIKDDESIETEQSGCDPENLTVETSVSGEDIICSATSAGGTSIETVNIKIDKTGPEITSPIHGGVYTFNQVVPADWLATDSLSGIDTEDSTIPFGDPIDTSTIGPKSFTVTATDIAGNTTEMEVEYEVVGYNFHGPHAPLKMNKTDFKKNRNIPVKFNLTNYLGEPVTDATATIEVNGVPGQAKGKKNTSNYFKYDGDKDQYKFNLSTKDLSLGLNEIIIYLSDGSYHTHIINI